MTRRQAHRGFTLLELMLVLALATLLFALVPPMLSKALPGVQSKAAAREIAAALRQARSLALQQQQETWVTFDVENRQMWLGGKSQRKKSLPDELELKLVTAESEVIDDEVGRIRFFPAGGSTGGRISLIWDERGYEVDVDWLTGRIRIDRWSPT